MANPYDSPFSSSSPYASGNTTFKTKRRNANGRLVKVDPYNQQFNATGDAPNQDYSKEAQAKRNNPQPQPAQKPAEQPKKKESFIDKTKRVAKGAVDAVTEDAKTFGRGLGQIGPGAEGARKSQQILQDSQTATIVEAGKHLRDPNLDPAKKDRWKKLLDKTIKESSETQAQIRKDHEQFMKDTDPIKMGAATASLGFDVATAGVGGATGVGVKEALEQTAKVGIKKGAKQLAKSAGKNAGKSALVAAPTGTLAPVVHDGKDAKAKDIAVSTAAAAGAGAVLPVAGGAIAHGGSKLIDKAIKRTVGDQTTRDMVNKARADMLLAKLKRDNGGHVPNLPENVVREHIEKSPLPGDIIQPQALPEDHGRYFNVDEKTHKVPVSDMILSKSPEEIGDSHLEAVRRMSAAAEGGMDKRDPILVHAQSDGKYKVLDGNATTTAAINNNWNELPVARVTSQIAPLDDHVKAAKQVIDAAHKNDPEFQSGMGEIASSLGLEYHGGPPKDLARSLSKIMDDYGGNASMIKDTIRGTMVVPNQNFDEAIAAIEAKYPGVKVKDGYKTPGYDKGYSDVKVTVTMPDGHKGEIILATPEMLEAKHNGGGHELYQIARDQTKSEAERKAAADQMTQLYSNAHAAANKRLASSGDLSYSSSSTRAASSAEISTAPSRTTPTSEEAPVKTTVSRNKPDGNLRTDSTTSSSVTKNVGDDTSIPHTISDEKANVKRKRTKTLEAISQEGGKRPEAQKQTRLEKVQADPKKRAAAEADLEKIDPALAGKSTTSKEAGQIFMDAQRSGKPITMEEARKIAAEGSPAPAGSAEPAKTPKSSTEPEKGSKPLKKAETLTPVQTAHMESINGYTHSTHFEQDYADMLRDMESSLKGGQIIKNADGTYKRTSEHSRFYRDFYAEHKKAPTRADWLEEAQRQLASGKAQFGASDDWKKLVEREHRDIPTAPLDLPKGPAVGETKVSKLAKGIEAKAVRNKLTKSFGDLPEYSKVNMLEQAEKAQKLLADDEQKANRIALGLEQPDAGLLPESVLVAVESKAIAEGNVDLLRQLAHGTRAGEASAMGQRIRVLAERDPENIIAAMHNLTIARVKAFERRAGSKVTVSQAVSKEVREIRAAKPKVVKETFESFVDSLKC